MAVAPTSSAVRWMSYFAENGILEDESAANLAWPSQQQSGAADCSADGAGCKVDETGDSHREVSGTRKRLREDCSKDVACSKANREKLRRDKLNDRFVDLSRMLEDGKAPKTDKATILCDAVRVISQLRQEAFALREGNAQLKEQIKELKSEKNELREEKARLKSEKEQLEQQVKTIPFQTGYVQHPPSMVQHPSSMQAAAAAAYASQSQAIMSAKMAAPAAVPPVAMWQWLPPASLDTSQDHVLRPPVA